MHIITVGTNVVQWVDCYRYLGFWTWFDLRTRAKRAPDGKLIGLGFLDEVERRVNHALHSTYEAHSIIRCAPPALGLQLYRTQVSGAGNYLLSLTEPAADTCKLLDKLSLHVARQALRLGCRCPSSLVWAESRLPLTAGVMARERCRFFLQLNHSPFDSIAKRILIRLSTANLGPDKWEPRQRSSPQRSWVHRILDLQRKYENHGIQPAGALDGSASGCTFSPFIDSKRAAGVYGRAVSAYEWQKAARRAVETSASGSDMGCDNDPTAPADASSPHPPRLQPVASSLPLLRPTPVPPTVHAGNLDFNYTNSLVPSVTGDRKTSTPISARGPGFSGGLLSLVTRQLPQRQLHALGAVRQGRSGLFHYPLAAPGRLLSETTHAQGDRSSGHTWGRNAYKVKPCPLCLSATEDTYHVLVECTHPSVASARAAVIDILPSRILTICALALVATDTSGQETLGPEGTEFFWHIRDLLATGIDWSSADGRFVLFRILCVLTWPESVLAGVESVTTPLSQALGRVFDHCNTKTHRLRRLANSWAGFAATSVLRIVDGFNTALTSANADPCNRKTGGPEPKIGDPSDTP